MAIPRNAGRFGFPTGRAGNPRSRKVTPHLLTITARQKTGSRMRTATSYPRSPAVENDSRLVVRARSGVPISTGEAAASIFHRDAAVTGIPGGVLSASAGAL